MPVYFALILIFLPSRPSLVLPLSFLSLLLGRPLCYSLTLFLAIFFPPLSTRSLTNILGVFYAAIILNWLVTLCISLFYI